MLFVAYSFLFVFDLFFTSFTSVIVRRSLNKKIKTLYNKANGAIGRKEAISQYKCQITDTRMNGHTNTGKFGQSNRYSVQFTKK